jgi:hypothetical protein
LQLDSEQEFLLDLSFQLSEIYQRPESSIMVIVTPGVQMVIGGSSESAYQITITALQSEIASTKNKRITHLLQEFMSDTLRINAKRGVIRFEGFGEANLATNGVTMLQEIEEMERRQNSEHSEILRSISRQSHRRGKKSSRPIFTERGKTPGPSTRAMAPSHLRYSNGEAVESRSTETAGPEEKTLKLRRSIMSFFRR